MITEKNKLNKNIRLPNYRHLLHQHNVSCIKRHFIEHLTKENVCVLDDIPVTRPYI